MSISKREFEKWEDEVRERPKVPEVAPPPADPRLTARKKFGMLLHRLVRRLRGSAHSI